MHDIWNPWHGCHTVSEGCANCYMYHEDRIHDNGDPSVVRRTANMRYPLSRDRSGTYKVKPGEMIRVCMTSDFFVEEADAWRDEAWDVIARRPDVKFFLLTKRAERIRQCLPHDWGDGWPNVMLNVTCENQRRADERIPLLFDVPAAHRGIMCAPFIGPVSIAQWLDDRHLIEQVLCDGENYEGSRPCHYEWVQRLSDECRQADVTFDFCGVGNNFVKDGVTYHFTDQTQQSRQAFRSGLSHEGRPMEWDLRDPLGLPIPQEELYQPYFNPVRCAECGMRLTCNGCSRCGRCGVTAW